MAKSIRSKWKRKCRAIKRERYAAKELARLKKMLGIKEEEKKPEESSEEKVMDTDQVIFLDAGAIKKDTEKKNKRKKKNKQVFEEEEDVAMSSEDENIEVDGEDGKKRIFNTKTLKDQNGQYPVWLHKRKIAKINQIGKKTIKKRSKKRKHR